MPIATPAPWKSNTSCVDRRAAILRRKDHRQLARAGNDEIGGAILIAKSVAADDDRLRPARHQARHVFAEQRIGSRKTVPSENIADGAVGRFPHLLEMEFFHARFVGRDGGAFDADAEFFDGFGRVDGDLVVGLVAVLDAEIVIVQLDIEIGKDQFILDELPDDARHLVAVDLDDGVFTSDLGH